MDREEVDHRPDFRLGAAFLAVLVALPAALVLWASSVSDRLPDPVARHWGLSGEADGFSSLSAVLTLAVVLSLVIAGPLGLVGVLARSPVYMRRMITGSAVWLVVFMNVLIADSLRVQLDLADPALAPTPGLGIALGTGLGLVVAPLVSLAARDQVERARAVRPPPAAATRLRNPPPEPAWASTTSRVDTSGKVVLAAAGTILILLATLVTWWLLSIAVLVIAIALGGTRLSVSIDADGLVATVARIRLLKVGIDEVAEADVVLVDPFWEFGGWGLRVDVAGRTGLVTRKGEAVRIRRGDDTLVLVTVDDADKAAATLNTLADRHHRLA